MTPKQQAFVREFQIDGNATQAAIRAGYGPRTAYSAGHRLLKNVEVAARIGELRDGRFAHLALTAERLDCEIAKVAYFNPAKLLKVNEGGTFDLDLSRATEEDMAALAIESSPQGLRIKTHDKVGAIALGYRRLRLLTDRVEIAASEDFALLLEAADKRVNG